MKDFIGKKLSRKRNDIVMPFIEGQLLDIGCGLNKLVKKYKNGIGVDVFDWGEVDIVVEDASKLPFEKESFDTITIVAALNHIPNRNEVIKECDRVLRKNGKIIITMIPPFISKIWHNLRKPWDSDQRERGMKDSELYGMTKAQILTILIKEGYKLTQIKSFMFFVNKLYIFKKY